MVRNERGTARERDSLFFADLISDVQVPNAEEPSGERRHKIGFVARLLETVGFSSDLHICISVNTMLIT